MIPRLSAVIVWIYLATIETSVLPAPHTEKKKFALEDLIPLRSEFRHAPLSGKWISHNQFVFIEPKKGPRKFNAETKEITEFLKPDTKIPPGSFITSSSPDDAKFILLIRDESKVFRRSSTAVYDVLDVEKNVVYPVANSSRLQLCVWSPAGKGSIAYVKDNDVYFVPNISEPNSAVQLTSDGKVGELYNGIADWIYEEEVLNSPEALWFSKKGSNLAVAVFNDSQVDTITYPIYGHANSIDSQYPEYQQLKYPKTGRTNPKVELRLYMNISGEQTIFSIPPPDIEDITDDPILGEVIWISDSKISVLWLNRRQNISALMICDHDSAYNAECKIVLAFQVQTRAGAARSYAFGQIPLPSALEDSVCELIRKNNMWPFTPNPSVRKETEGWIDITPHIYDPSGSKFVKVEPAPFGKDRYPHLLLTDVNTNSALDLTPTDMTVYSIVGWHFETQTIFFIASPGDKPWIRQLWAYTPLGNRCVSCSVRGECSTAEADFAPGAAYGTIVCSAYNKPPQTVMFDLKENTITLWSNNSNLENTLKQYDLPEPRFFIQELMGGIKASVKLLLPPNMEDGTKYPMVLRVYGGPGYTLVQDKFELEYSTYLVSNRSFIVCYTDVRGSGALGIDALFSINNALGTHEVFDTLEVIRTLVGKYDFIDASKIAVWGWSYGGYLSAMMLASDSEHLLKGALSVAPVTSWLYYDSIYTERYMGTPQNNSVGYERSDLVRKIEKLRGRKYFLIHGTADDNVHYQNSMILGKELQQKDIEFEEMSYADESHSLSGVSRHLYHTIDHFWTHCFSD